MRLLPALATAVLAALLSAPAATAAPLAELSLHERSSGRELPLYWHQGRRYAVGEPGQEYEIRLRNLGPQRLLAVTSVDGVNVLSGATAAPGQSGYIVEPWGEARIDGWRKSLAEVAAFSFTALPDSYAARTGRPDNVGVIGVAVFREAAPEPPPEPCCHRWNEEQDRFEEPSAAPQPAQKSAPEASAAPAPSAGAGADARSDSAAPSDSRARDSARLGTGHGQRLESAARYTAFERASPTPDQIISIWYDSRARLTAQGVLRTPRPTVRPKRPEAFPNQGFVPDP